VLQALGLFSSDRRGGRCHECDARAKAGGLEGARRVPAGGTGGEDWTRHFGAGLAKCYKV
jgi:hypothetical protein